MPASHFHIDRLREQLQHEIGTVIAQEMRDPRIPSIVTVTRIKLAQDTRNATVFVSIFGDEKVKNRCPCERSMPGRHLFNGWSRPG